MKREKLSAAVLTGGASRRMGTDKALITLGGRTLLQRAIQTLSTVADDVQVIGDRPAYHGLGAPVVPDDYPNAGTLGGIATALRSAVHDRVLVVACDMPLLSPTLLGHMSQLAVDDDIVIPRRPVDHIRQGGRGTYETLHAIYRRSCLPYIERKISDGDVRVIGFFDDVRVRTLDEAWLRTYDSDLSSLQNVNTREELERVRLMITDDEIE